MSAVASDRIAALFGRPPSKRVVAQAAAPTPRIIPAATRTAPLNVANIPQLLKDTPHWVAHRKKKPIDPKSGKPASVSDWMTWGPLEEALAFMATGEADGIGYVFTEDDGLLFVDIDNGIDTDGKIASWAQPVVDETIRLSAPIEVSPSGRGFHIIARGKKTFTWSSKPILGADGEKVGAIEVYDHGRYATVTGRLIDGASTAIVDGVSILEAARRVGEQGGSALAAAPAYLHLVPGSGDVGALSAGVFDPSTGAIQPRTSPVPVEFEPPPRASMDLRKLASALAHVDAGPYESWRSVIHALAGATGVGSEDERHALAVAWSKTDPEKFDEAAVRKVFDSHQTRPGEITTASIYKAARSAKWSWDDPAEAAALLDDARAVEVRRATTGEYVLIARSDSGQRPRVQYVPSDEGERIVFGAMRALGAKKPTMAAARAHLDRLISGAHTLPPIDINVRVGRSGDGVVHDLGTDDGQAIITRAGTVTVERAPDEVCFMLGQANGALPLPALDEVQTLAHAREVFDEWFRGARVPEVMHPLMTAWIVAALQPGIVTPILEVSGPPGSGKTVFAAQLQQMIDPGATPGIRSARLRPEDVAAAVATFYVVSVDNVSRLSAEDSDLLCQMATGATIVSRRLYEQRSSVALSIKCPIILTSIAPVLVRSDAADRAIVVELPARRLRTDEAEVNERFERMRPRLLAAAHRMLAAAMQHIGGVSASSSHRLAGFVRLGRAISIAGGEKPSAFDDAMGAMKRRQAASALEDGSLGGAVLEIVRQRAQRAAAGDFKPPTRRNLRKQAEDGSTLAEPLPKGRHAVLFTGEALRRELLQPTFELAARQIALDLPKSARGLWEALARLTPTFQGVGVSLQLGEFDKRQRVAAFVLDDQQQEDA